MRIQKLLLLIISGLLLNLCVASGRELQEFFTVSDNLYAEGDVEGSLSELEKKITDLEDLDDQAAVAWRISRGQYNLGLQSLFTDDSGAVSMEFFQAGLSSALENVQTDAAKPENYYWQAMNLGGLIDGRGFFFRIRRAGEQLEIFSKALDADSNFLPAYLEISRLYLMQPTFLSLGDVDLAVNTARTGLRLAEQAFRNGELEVYPFDFVLLLAEGLSLRNWSAEKRIATAVQRREKEANVITELERSKRYEGLYSIPFMSDSTEMNILLQDMLGILERDPLDHPDFPGYIQRARELISVE